MRKNINIIPLIKSCLKNNRKAQKLIFEKYYIIIARVCYRYADNKSESVKWIHFIFVDIFSKLNTFNGKTQGEFISWLKIESVNYCIKQIRIKYPELFQNLDESICCGTDEESDVHTLRNTEPEIIINALHELNPKYRTIFNMFIMDDYSHKEIAKKLDITEAGSKSNIFSAREKLKELLINKT